jgi:hypothetical protein
MLFGLKGDKVVREHYPLNDDVASSARVRAFCAYANYYGERIGRLMNEVLYCLGKFEDEYKKSPRGGSSKLSPECERWDSGAKDAIEWLMRSIADDQLDKEKQMHGRDAKKLYHVETNHRQFDTTVELLQKVHFDMMRTIEFLTLSLWLGWVDEMNDTEAARVLGVIMMFWKVKGSHLFYSERFVLALQRALQYLHREEIFKVEQVYSAFVEKCDDQYTGVGSRPLIDALGKAWVGMVNPTVLAAHMGSIRQEGR